MEETRERSGGLGERKKQKQEERQMFECIEKIGDSGNKKIRNQKKSDLRKEKN
jgi:hypothetical protein